MTTEEILTAGAMALYRAENQYRVEEFAKGSDPQAAIAADFEQYRSRYTRKFADFRASLAAMGLTVTKAA
ncbi:hypothetical protein HL658_19040 [Azospirillum sp. RWY-5-1]|uniref:Uncharacterized protein n=1 Tax=Azospirillum oleiclasticum TaxID=2735135 RepID=A0ABX2TDF0_9PROT|nr:hypothetical protein [Azospirillum oleiclasticum]NYZ14649.1 hypothetical protein [Azospirillum oleiclasticum]NYZ22364.1 hypothetical protein [Azospirillum oleiclasticum]